MRIDAATRRAHTRVRVGVGLRVGVGVSVGVGERMGGVEWGGAGAAGRGAEAHEVAV